MYLSIVKSLDCFVLFRLDFMRLCCRLPLFSEVKLQAWFEQWQVSQVGVLAWNM